MLNIIRKTYVFKKRGSLTNKLHTVNIVLFGRHHLLVSIVENENTLIIILKLYAPVKQVNKTPSYKKLAVGFIMINTFVFDKCLDSVHNYFE